jgi:hypothetical protein
MKKIFLIALIIISFSVVVSAKEFVDMPDNWSTAALVSAVENGLLTGDGVYIKPNNPLTRAQLAAVVTRAFGACSEADISAFSDIPENAWYKDEIARAYKMNVLKGVGDNLMAPEKNVTRQEAFVVLGRAFCLDESADDTCLEAFSDHSLVASWARGTIASMVSQKYVSGSNGKLNPQANITRAEFAQLMYNLVADYVDSEQDLKSEFFGNVIIRTYVPAIDTVKFSGNVIISDSIDLPISFKNVSVEKNIILRGSADITFDGKAEGILAPFSDIKLFVNGLNSIGNIQLTSGSVIIDNSIPGPSPSPVTPPVNDGEEEDIWTNFH